MKHLNAVNDYTWNILRSELGWTKVNNIIPMMPTREQPEFDGQTKPYIVYGGSRETGRDNVAATRLYVVQYVIYASTEASSSTKTVSDAVELLDDAYSQFDVTAERINVNAHHPSNPRRNGLAGAHINWTQVLNTQTPDPGSTEGGKAQGFISIRYSYNTQPMEHSILY